MKKNNIPALRFPQFNEPWVVKKLGEVGRISAGGDISSENVSQTSNDEYRYPIYANSDKDKGLYGYSNIYKQEENCVTITGRGNVGIAVARFEKFYPIVRLLVLKPFFKYDVKCLEYAINRLNIPNESTGVPQLTGPQLSSLPISLPTLPEQQKIADFLSGVDEKIGQLERRLALEEQYKKGMMQRLFDQEIRFKDDNGNEFPDWEEKKLGEVGEIINGLTYSPNNICTSEDGVLVLRSSNIKNDSLCMDDNVFVNCIGYNPVKQGDILICVRNGSRNLIGKNIIIPKEIEGVAFGAFMSVYRSSENKFIIQILKTDRFYKEIHKNLGATINSINNSDLKQFPISLPTLPEQQKIADFLSSLDDKIGQTKAELEKARVWKRGLMQRMFV